MMYVRWSKHICLKKAYIYIYIYMCVGLEWVAFSYSFALKYITFISHFNYFRYRFVAINTPETHIISSNMILKQNKRPVGLYSFALTLAV